MTVERVQALAALLARSFFDDPMARWVEPGYGRRLSSLTRQFELLYSEAFVHRRIIDVTVSTHRPGRLGASVHMAVQRVEDNAVGAGIREERGAGGERDFAAIDGLHPPESHCGRAPGLGPLVGDQLQGPLTKSVRRTARQRDRGCVRRPGLIAPHERDF